MTCVIFCGLVDVSSCSVVPVVTSTKNYEVWSVENIQIGVYLEIQSLMLHPVDGCSSLQIS